MKNRKKLLAVSILLIVALVLTGCTANQKAIFDASMKMQKVNSAQQHITMSIGLTGSGLDPMVQEQVDQIAAMLKDANFELTVNTNSNEEKTKVQSQVDMNLTMAGMEISMPYWVDMDLTSKDPKLKEIFRLPQIAKATFPEEFRSKEYMVMDIANTSNPEFNTLDMTKLMNFGLNYQEKWTDFLVDYANRFNPNFEVVSVPTNDNTQKFSIRLDDKGFKELLSYTVNNFAQDEEALGFIEEYFNMIFEVAGQGTLDGSMSFEESFMETEIDATKTLDQFNSLMETLRNVTLIGDKGIQLNYTIADGYIVESSGSIDLQIDLSEISQLMPMPTIDMDSPEMSGILSLTVNYDTDTSNINLPVDIQIPELTPGNSFDYFDFIEASLALVEPIPDTTIPASPMETDYIVQPGDTLATIALNHYGSYDNYTKIYQANRNLFNKSNNRLDAGMVLTLPTEGLLAPLVAENVKQVYTVKTGDTLGIIAKKMYGDSSLYTKIFEANKDRLKSPNLIFEGQKLVIPN